MGRLFPEWFYANSSDFLIQTELWVARIFHLQLPFS